MFNKANHPLQCLTNRKNTILATTCQNCMRIFPPTIDPYNRSRHNKICFLYTTKTLIEANDDDEEQLEKSSSSLELHDQNLSGTSSTERKIELLNKLVSESTNKRVRDLNIKRLRSRKNYMLKRMDKNLNYNINLESLMIKSLVSDLMPVETFYLNGMKTFFNKLLRIGYELGQQPGTVLPLFDELLPSYDSIENSLDSFVDFEKFKEIFEQVSDVFQTVGGTIAIESSCNLNMKNDNLLVISLIILDEWTPKRLVYDFIQSPTSTSIQERIDKLLDKLGLKLEMCNLFVDKKAQKLFKPNKFQISSSCFGAFLNDVVIKVFDQTILTHLSSEDQESIVDLKRTVDQIPPFIEFLLKKCDLPSELRSILRCEFDPRWFVQASISEKLLILLTNYYDIVVQKIEESNEEEKEKISNFLSKTHQQIPILQQYNAFVQIFITHFEACAINRRATLHLVIPKFRAIHKQLKKCSEMEQKPNKIHFQQFCSLAIDIMDSMEEEFFNKTHFLATLLAPGHQNLLKDFYNEELIMDYENELIQAIKNSQPNEENGSVDTPNDIEVEIEKFFEAESASRIDPLEWWSKNEFLAPRVCTFAQRLFTIPAVSCQADKTIPQHLSNSKFNEFLSKRILFNWTISSELPIKKLAKKQ